MGEVLNLNRARKARRRAEAEVQAAANRAAFGRTGAEKKATKDAAARDRARLDGAHRENKP